MGESLSKTPNEAIILPFKPVASSRIIETLSSNLSPLAERLTMPQDLTDTITKFINGHTTLTDVSGFTSDERSRVLTAINPQTNKLAERATQNFLSVIACKNISGDLGSWNFLADASKIVERNQEAAWAVEFNKLFQLNDHPGVERLCNILRQHNDNRKQEIATFVLTYLAVNRENRIIIGRFLAGRSVMLEKLHRDLYGVALNKAKLEATKAMIRLAEQTGLHRTHLDRSLAQIQQTDHAALDHLIYGETEYDNQCDGMYHPGSLRIRIHYGGSSKDRSIKQPDHVIKTARHELFHAASAQSIQQHSWRMGLTGDNNQGTEVNEAMAEFQAQYAGEFPDMVQLQNGKPAFICNYKTEVSTLYELQQKDPESFNTLFRANYGQVDNDSISQALSAYYDNLAEAYNWRTNS